MCRPELITEYALRKNFVIGPAQGALFNGYHVMRGMIVGAGPELRRGAGIDGARILDVAPTVLHLLGLPVPTSMEGQVLADAFEPTALDRRPVRIADVAVPFTPPSRAGTEREEIERSLRDLGYM